MSTDTKAAKSTNFGHLPLSTSGPQETSLTLSPKKSAIPSSYMVFLPTNVQTLDEQVKRAYAQYSSRPNDLAKNTFMTSLKEQNEVLYYRLILDHLKEMFSVIYTPTEVVSDGQQILGIGDQGVGAILISIAKLVIYTLCAGIHPSRTLPVVLDCGTDDSGQIQPEIACFNDDVQGTGCVTLAAIMAAFKVSGTKWEEARFVMFGSGSAGTGIADQIQDAIVQNTGKSRGEAGRQIWCVDKPGLLLQGKKDQLTPAQLPFAREDKEWE
ncbi:hypothetical protein BKA58DRAFT_425238, partial [Alternaria rosae]|uniref:uncharacterized protein n=1 Tax=Alternaria rosae TaxID=1187941 RepID=UPI001E8CF2DF